MVLQSHVQSVLTSWSALCAYADGVRIAKTTRAMTARLTAPDRIVPMVLLGTNEYGRQLA